MLMNNPQLDRELKDAGYTAEETNLNYKDLTDVIMKFVDKHGPGVFRSDPTPSAQARKELVADIEASIKNYEDIRAAERGVVIHKKDGYC